MAVARVGRRLRIARLRSLIVRPRPYFSQLLMVLACVFDPASAALSFDIFLLPEMRFATKLLVGRRPLELLD